jgi:hypothetical protein
MMRPPPFVASVLLLAALAASAATAASPSVPPNAWTALKATGDGPMYGGLPGRRGWIQVAFDPGSGEIVMFGGDAETYLSDLFTYSFRENRWHLRRAHPDPQGPCRRDNHNFVYDPVGKKFWMWNGSIGDNKPPNAQPGCYQGKNAGLWTYDRGSNAWTFVGDAYERMLAAGAAFDPESRLIVQFGGEHSLSSTTTDWTVLLDTRTGRFERLSNLSPSPPPSVNIQGGLVYIPPIKKFLLFGGRQSSGSKVAYDQTWLFDPQQRKWKRLQPPVSPPARDLHSMVFDEANGVVILHGGRAADRGGTFADTWVFDPAKGTWTDITRSLAEPGPPMRYGNGVYDPVNKVMLMVPGEWGHDTYALRYEPKK